MGSNDDTTLNTPEMPQAMKRDLAKLNRLAYLLDNSIGLPGTRYRIGLDPLIGLVPIVGDVVTLIVSLVLLFYAGRYKIGGGVIFLMAINILLDYGLGSIPVLGDLLDFGYKANARNARLMHKELSKRLPHHDDPTDKAPPLAEANDIDTSAHQGKSGGCLTSSIAGVFFVAGLAGIFYLLFQLFSWIGTNIF